MIKHICKEDHKDIENIFNDIPESQSGAWRHKCAACAYEMGRKHGRDEINISVKFINIVIKEWFEDIQKKWFIGK